MLKQVQHDAKYRHICELVNVIKQTHYPQTPSSKRHNPQTSCCPDANQDYFSISYTNAETILL